MPPSGAGFWGVLSGDLRIRSVLGWQFSVLSSQFSGKQRRVVHLSRRRVRREALPELRSAGPRLRLRSGPARRVSSRAGPAPESDGLCLSAEILRWESLALRATPLPQDDRGIVLGNVRGFPRRISSRFVVLGSQLVEHRLKPVGLAVARSQLAFDLSNITSSEPLIYL